MSYTSLMKDRFISTIKAFGFSVRTMLQARKKLPKNKGLMLVFLMLLPIISVALVSNPIFALTWLICLAIYLPILDAYAYAVVYGDNNEPTKPI